MAPDRSPPARGGPARECRAPPPPPRRRGDVRDRHEPELHERLRHRLPVLRLLPEAGRSRGLHPHRRRGHDEDRRSRGAGRHHGAPPGRAQPVPPPRVLPGPRPRDPAPVPRRAAAFLHGVRDPDHGPRLDALRSRGAGAPPRRRAANASRRRRRDPLGARPSPDRPEEGRPRQAGSRSTARRTGWGSARRPR